MTVLQVHGLIPGKGRIFFYRRYRVQTCFGVHPASYPIGTGWGALSSRAKRPGREADHSLPSSAEVKNAWSLTKHRIRLHDAVFS
jgi:hypothetical protein